MKENLYIFSNSILRKKNNTLLVESLTGVNAAHEADIFEEEGVMLLSPQSDGNGASKKFIPAENIDSIFSFGCIKFNSIFLSLASSHSIPVHIFNYYGRYIGSFMPKAEISSGNILLAQAEYYNTPGLRLELAKKFILGAAQNTINNLLYYLYRNVPLDLEISQIKSLKEQLLEAESIGEILGIEGNIKSLYYRSWHKIFKQDVEFEKRVKRPPDNMVNSLISFGNVMLYSVCLNEIFRTGLIPSLGFLHSPGDNRFPLSFDIAEIFKPLIVDKTIFRIINMGMLDEGDFFRKNDFLIMKEKAKKTFVESIENKLKTTIFHNDMKRHVSYKTLIRLECYNIIKHLKDKEEYNPFISEV